MRSNKEYRNLLSPSIFWGGSLLSGYLTFFASNIDIEWEIMIIIIGVVITITVVAYVYHEIVKHLADSCDPEHQDEM